jgi:tetratricopeptide (TPR) repeat protein
MLTLTLALGCLVAGEPAEPPDLLGRAAALVERGDEEAAVPYLAAFVREHPDHLKARLYLGELLARLRRPAEARPHLERFCADAADGPEPLRGRLIDAHSRLAEVAAAAGDAFAEHLHRGVGSWLLARRSAELGADGSLSAEALLCRAAGELTQALRERPGSARANWHLAQVWSQLGQRQPAERCLRAATEAAPSDLTPAERQALALATAARTAVR